MTEDRQRGILSLIYLALGTGTYYFEVFICEIGVRVRRGCGCVMPLFVVVAVVAAAAAGCCLRVCVLTIIAHHE